MVLIKIVYIAIIVFVVNCFSNGLTAENYSLDRNIQTPLLTTNLSTTDILAVSASSTSFNPTPKLQSIIAGGKTLGALGTICWTTGTILEITGIIKLAGGGDGENLLITGILFDLFSPILSCIGETMVINTLRTPEVSFIDNNFELKPKGRGYYGRSFLFLGIGVLSGLMASASQNVALSTIAFVAGGVSNVLRGSAAIVPLVRVNKVSTLVNLQTRPTTINQKGALGLALSCNF